MRALKKRSAYLYLSKQKEHLQVTFSNILSDYIHKKNIKTYALAQYCGIDRSNMYKIINGKRKPTSIEMVDKISKFMKLSISESADLMEAYLIEVTGHDNYYRRKHVAQFFQNFRLPQQNFPSHISDTNDLLQIKNLDSMILSSPTEINRALLYILPPELCSDSGEIQLLIQPDYDFLFDILAANYCHPNVKIDHIICLNSKTDLMDHCYDYNLHCLEKVLPVYGNVHNYNCYYYYNDVSYTTEVMTMIPYAVMTRHFACLLSNDLQSGCLISRASFLKLFHSIFEEHLAKVSPLLKPMGNLAEQLNYMMDLGTSALSSCALQPIPCMTPFLTKEILEKHIIQQLPNRTQLIEQLEKYISASYNKLIFPSTKLIFSLNGVRKFLETGRIGEYPSSIYHAIEPKYRIYLVKQLLISFHSHPYHVLKQDIGSLEDELYLFINQQKGYLMFLAPHTEQLIYLDIEEPGLLSTFWDYCENLDDELFFSPEEVEQELKSLIAEFS